MPDIDPHPKPHLPSASHRLISMEVVGGFLDQLRLDFSPGLNCIIGGRGAGKTTVIELIRFVLDIPPEDSFKKHFEDLVKANLGAGSIKAKIQTREGMNYIVLRSANQPPIVLTADEKPTDLNLKAGGLFQADIYSLNQIENVADHPDRQLALLDSFDLPAIAKIDQFIRQTVVKLNATASELAPLDAEITALREETAELATVEERLRTLDVNCSAEELPVQEAASLQALRAREKTAMEELLRDYSALGSDLSALKGAVAALGSRYIVEDMLAGPNDEIFKKLSESLAEASTHFDAELEQAIARLRSNYHGVQEMQGTLAGRHTEQEVAFVALTTRHKAFMEAAASRSPLHDRLNELLGKRRTLDAKETRRDELDRTRRGLLDDLANARNERFRIREAIAARINKALAPDVQVEISQDGNRDQYERHLESIFRSHNIFGEARAKLVRSLWPQELAQICMNHDKQTLIGRSGVSEKMAENILAALADHARIFALETVEPVDDPHIALNDCGSYKRANELSTGQKCTTILPILLMENERPLVVDQPEDNLDNRYVSDNVVRTLHMVKPKRQIIFTTHNPNIPVLGDAECVFVMESDGTHGLLREYGTVDACRSCIVNLLEGGEEAFRQRAQRYGT